MNKIHHLQKSSDIKHDAQLAHELNLICKTGLRYYRKTAHNTEFFQLKNLALDMADVRAEIIRDMYNGFKLEQQPVDLHPTLGELLAWYHSDPDTNTSTRVKNFLNTMFILEHGALIVLRGEAEDLITKRFSYIITKQIANLQITYDQVKLCSNINRSFDV